MKKMLDFLISRLPSPVWSAWAEYCRDCSVNTFAALQSPSSASVTALLRYAPAALYSNGADQSAPAAFAFPNSSLALWIALDVAHPAANAAI